jgi:preprotein translocase subunit SecF
VQVSSIGPTLGSELFKNSMVAVALALFAIAAYLTVRFQLEYGIIALLSLLHDVLFVIGAFSILGLFFGVHIDSLFITAVLTVVGFSVHDTIVVFDRIRENSKFLAKKATFSEIVNASVNQTLARSINTSLTTLITLAALYLFGGVTTKDFVLAMILGIAIGTYSSIFFASMVLAWYMEKKEAKVKVHS